MDDLAVSPYPLDIAREKGPMKTKVMAVIFAVLIALAVAVPAFADSPFAGNSGNFSGATCPNGNNPHCPPQGGG
jgi:hypothetical protein